MKKFLQIQISHFIQNKQAISLVLFAGFAMVGTTIALTSINISNNNKIKAALQALADQSTLSAQVITDKSQRVPKCESYFKQGILYNQTLKDKVEIVNLTCDFSTENGYLLFLNSNINIKSSIGGTFGVGEKTIRIYAKATSEQRKIEIVYALSTQGTMCSETTATSDDDISLVPDEGCKKFQIIRAATKNSITRLSDIFLVDQLKIGVVPYNYKVKFPNLSNIPTSLTNIENERNFFKEFLNEEPLSKIIPLTNDYQSVKASINTMTLTPEAVSWGRSDLGMHVAALMLDPDKKQFFNNHAVENWSIQDNNIDTTSTEHQKYVILIADAANMGCCFTNNPSGNYDNQYIYSYKPYNDHMLDVCQKLKNKKVTIFTIMLNGSLTGSSGAIANNLMARCASGTYLNPAEEAAINTKLKCNSKTHCYDVSSDEEIKAAFENITARISKPTILK
jgi:hypothetical protein